ncbi:hypothetical protein RHSIM_RhsimUnG0134100 [Rhododendron simsii]|uniref:mitogen-activated protein kinase kinase n=1 Tax=Rhododendron simsii TaxID=118357 RepID=A0A834FVR5_RHOSS|nr:hypothetical protein RHSIM_RhsimUnG0134100 [Rhododendron simsii]
MAGLEELKKKLTPLFDAEKGFSSRSTLDPCDSYTEKREQLLTKIRTLCEAPCCQGLVEYHGAFYTPDSGQINIALEYMDGGSLADVIRVQKCIPEPVLSSMFQKLLHGLSYLHGVRHLVHRDIKPANLLVNLKGEPKITDFGISAGLENSMAMILDDPSPSPPNHVFSPEFCSFIDACLKKDADSRPTAEQMLTIHYYLLFDGPDELWQHTRTFYNERSTFRDGVAIRVSGSFIVGNQFLVCGDGVQAEGLPNFKDLSIDMSRRRMGTFQEQFIMEPGNVIGRDLCEEGEGFLN